jgi:lipoprotein-releasing system permease protein
MSFIRIPYELVLGWRYTRAGRASRRNGFISFISGVSMLGICLGVAALIIVLSVMNGFQKEVRERMLSVLSHAEVVARDGGALLDTEALAQRLSHHPQVVAVAPYVTAQALLARGEEMRGVVVRGIDPVQERGVADYAALLPASLQQGWEPGGFGVVLGVEIAHQMGVRVGDRVTLVAPGGQVTPAGVLPRLKQLEVLGLIDTGHYEFDATLAVMQIDDAQRLLRLEGPNGLRLKLRDAQQARAVASELSLQIDPMLVVRDWTRQNRNWFAAVQIEKRMMFIILTLIVAVAAFNLVSTLVMTVTDKQSDIAILRTLGASPGSVMGIFMVQGALVGVVGTLSGLLLGLAVAFNIDVIVPTIEHVLGLRFLPQDIYLISRMPSDPQLADIGPVVVLSLLLALLATLYPSWRASRVQPAEALRYE